MRRFLAFVASIGLLAAPALATAQARPAPASALQAAAPQLRPYQSQQGRFSVDFPPGTPQHAVKAITLQGGIASTLHQTWVELNHSSVAYMVMFNDYPADYVDQAPEDVLASARSGAVDGKTVLSDRAITLNGVPGRAFTATDHDGWHYTVHQYLAGARLYQLIVVSDKNHPAADTEEFMRSFRIQ